MHLVISCLAEQQRWSRAAVHVKMLKPLRSCSRCRKNKVKCDSANTRPDPCTACAKRGLPCTLDYVVPPRRSDELKKIHHSVSMVKSCVDRLLSDSMYQDGKAVTWSQMKKTILKPSLIPTKIIKIDDSFFVKIMATESCLFFNNFELDLDDVEEVIFDFLETMKVILPFSDSQQLPPIHDLSYSLTSTDGILFLVTILNFYFDIPNFDYLRFYDHFVGQSAASQLWLFSNVVLYGPSYFSSRVSSYSFPPVCPQMSMDSTLRPSFAKLYYCSDFNFQSPDLYSLQERFHLLNNDPLLHLLNFKCKPLRIIRGGSTSLSLSQLSICQFNDKR